MSDLPSSHLLVSQHEFLERLIGRAFSREAANLLWSLAVLGYHSEARLLPRTAMEGPNLAGAAHIYTNSCQPWGKLIPKLVEVGVVVIWCLCVCVPPTGLSLAFLLSTQTEVVKRCRQEGSSTASPS